MFCKLALRNIRRSIKDYAIYFFTLVLGVAIFYIFNAIESQSAMMALSSYMSEIVKLMNNILSGVSVFVALVLGFLVIYAARFLVKRRSQEFGTYMVLGMGKKRISAILLLETLVTGIVSLVVGLATGVIISQFTSALVASMFEADMTSYRFVFSSAACTKTLIYFTIIFLLVMVLNTLVVAKQRLIKLLQAKRTTEEIKIRKTWCSIAAFALGVALLGWAYSMVTVNRIDLNDGNVIIVLAAGALGTLLFFWSVATIVTKIIQRTKFYNRGLTTFTLRQFSSTINTSTVAMTMICLMLFVTICVSVSAVSLRETINSSIESAMPVDLEYQVLSGKDTKTEDILKSYDVNLAGSLAERATYNIYYDEDLTFREALQGATADLGEIFYLDAPMPIMYLDDYNALAKLFGNPEIELETDQYLIAADFPSMIENYEQSLKSHSTIKLGDKTLYYLGDTVVNAAYQLSSTVGMNTGLIVIPNGIKISGAEPTQYVAGNFRNDVDAVEFSDKMREIEQRELDAGRQSLNIETKQILLNSNIGINAIVTFVALYLGIIFLIASAALLALKQLTDSSDNREKYAILQKLGASNRMIDRALMAQIGIFFLLPLIVALIHSICGLMFCDFILEALGGIKLGSAVAWVCLIFAGIYGGYFAITYYNCRRMIHER